MDILQNNNFSDSVLLLLAAVILVMYTSIHIYIMIPYELIILRRVGDKRGLRCVPGLYAHTIRYIIYVKLGWRMCAF